jgi:hypothetical protein
VKGNVISGQTVGWVFSGVLILLIVLLAGNDLFSRDVQSKVTRQSSLEAFKKGDYESAYRQFNELLVTFPKDPLYKYYSGVCLVKMQRDPENAVTLLTEARQDGSVVRTVPSDALFWLGRAQQMSGRFEEAAKSYNDFTDLSGKRAARELGIPEYLQQCAARKGQLAAAEPVKVMPGREAKSRTEPLQEMPVQKTGKDPGKVVAANKPLPADTDRILSEALDYQYKADSIKNFARDQKNNQADLYQKQADQKFAEAKVAMKSDTATQGKSVQQPVKAAVKRDNGTAGGTAAKPVPEKKVAVPAGQPEGVLLLFKVDPKPLYAPGEKIQVNPQQPPGLIYRIQVGVFRNPVAPSYSKGITPVYGIKNKGATVTSYYAGMFRKLADAKNALAQVKQKGFKDAFVVAFSGGKVVSSERATLMEKEWSMIPFIADTKYMPDSPIDTIPPVLSFRVEVIRALKPVSEENFEGMKKLTGTRGLDIETLDDGMISYLIGRFITFESAEEYADLFRRNGYRDSKVVAWLGKKEIPLETAKQLFEEIK